MRVLPPLPFVCTATVGFGRGRRVATLILVLWVLSLADLGFTLWAHFCTPFFEVNPFARALLEQDRVTALVSLKLLLTGTGVLIFWRLRRFARAEVALWLMVAAYVALAVHWSDYATGIASIGPPM